MSIMKQGHLTAQQFREARKVASPEHVNNMIRFGELSPRLERSHFFPGGLTVQWIDDQGDVQAQWLCQTPQALYKQLHSTFGTAYAVAFCRAFRYRVEDSHADVDLSTWDNEGGLQC